MARAVVWAQGAAEDIEEAAEYIARDSTRYAASLVDQVVRSARNLGYFSDRGRVVPEYQDQSIREVFIGSYRLIYRVEQDRVVVLALIHGARLLRSSFKEREPA